jgi:O-antigen/teichoic acid export membrane protein
MRQQILPQKIREFSLVIGENALELAVNLFAMVLVERAQGQEGLGVYSYLLSLFFVVGYLSELGVPRYVEREMPLNEKRQDEIIKDAVQATIVLGLVCVILSLMTGALDAAHMRTKGMAAAFLIIGISIPFRNLNRLRISILHGQGRHDEVAKLETKKRLAFLVSIFALLTFRVGTPFLVLSFLATELVTLVLAARKVTLPPARNARRDLHRLRNTLRESGKYLLTDDAFDVVLYVDFLVLGLFVSSWDLGVYAEASILARFFLIIPMSIRPIFRHKYCVLAAKKNSVEAGKMVRRTTAILFYVHSVMALYTLLYYTQILQAFFHTRGEAFVSYRIFTVIIPGLLFYSSVTASDAIYEAQGRIKALRTMVLVITAANLVLNLYLVPFARVFGAATATTISMLLYFVMFGMHVPQMFRLKKMSFFLAGGGVYLTYVLVQSIQVGWLLTVFALPIVLFLIFFFIGFFDLEQTSQAMLTNGHLRPNRLREV